MAEGNSRDVLEEVLGSPVLLGFDEKTERIRRNLMIVASLIVIYKVNGLSLKVAKSSFLGLKFDGLTSERIDWVLLSLVGYHLVHFVWASWDVFLEWLIRLTGTRSILSAGSAFGDGHSDHVDNPRHSTLLNWWLWKARDLERERVDLKRLENALPDAKECFEKVTHPEVVSAFMHTFHERVGEVKADIAKNMRALDKVEEVLNAARIPASLGRFENWFKWFLRSQGLRWLLLEFSLPVVLGGWAASRLFTSVVAG